MGLEIETDDVVCSEPAELHGGGCGQETRIGCEEITAGRQDIAAAPKVVAPDVAVSA